MSISVKLVAGLGFRTHQGLLALIVPAVVAKMVWQEVAEEIASQEAAEPRFVDALGWGGCVA
jgi:hypothetical protein